MSPDGRHGIRVHSMDPPSSMIWGTPGDTTWTWQLDPRQDGRTRVITRVRSRYRWLSPAILFSALLEFGDIWMMRKMLLNLRDRAEGSTTSTAQRPYDTPASARGRTRGSRGSKSIR
ncbi:hypothetical protein [Georgenia sp. SUBG003]|uniref:hypothetical protein n=1 Tax=Georgenia sp. SUBG003 TaxID=1497974 RepID=UPI003AB29543